MLIKELATKAKLHDSESVDVLERLHGMDTELAASRHEVAQLKMQLDTARSDESLRLSAVAETRRMRSHARLVFDQIRHRTDTPVHQMPHSQLTVAFRKVRDTLPQASLDKLRREGYVDADGSLTRRGVLFFRDLDEPDVVD